MNIVHIFTWQKQYLKHMKRMYPLPNKVNGIYLNTLLLKLCCHQNTSDIREAKETREII
uniref:Uncharacterized protein n=1 Tax=Solanum lycopersicum TaxID=4081 RepID=A0A3Q7IDE5_SOLLC